MKKEETDLSNKIEATNGVKINVEDL